MCDFLTIGEYSAKNIYFSPNRQKILWVKIA